MLPHQWFRPYYCKTMNPDVQEVTNSRLDDLTQFEYICVSTNDSNSGKL